MISLFLDNIEKFQEISKLSFEYFWKYYGKSSFALLEQMLHFP